MHSTTAQMTTSHINVVPKVLNIALLVTFLFSDHLHSTDQTLFHLLSAFPAVLRHCKIARSAKWSALLLPVFEVVQSLINYSHDWVQLVCSQIFGCVFSEWDPNEISPKSGITSTWFVPDNVEEKLFELSRAFSDQMKANVVNEKLVEQVIKNLLFLARVFDNNYFRNAAISEEEDQFLPVHKGVLLILRKLRAMVAREHQFQPRQIIKRVGVLKFCAAFFINIQNPERILGAILDPISRVVNASSGHGKRSPELMKLRELSSEVLDIIRSKVDAETFPHVYMKVTQMIARKHKSRKAFLAQQAITNPVKAANMKILRNQKKKVALKRKSVIKRPYTAKKFRIQ